MCQRQKGVLQKIQPLQIECKWKATGAASQEQPCCPPWQPICATDPHCQSLPSTGRPSLSTWSCWGLLGAQVCRKSIWFPWEDCTRHGSIYPCIYALVKRLKFSIGLCKRCDHKDESLCSAHITAVLYYSHLTEGKYHLQFTSAKCARIATSTRQTRCSGVFHISCRMPEQEKQRLNSERNSDVSPQQTMAKLGWTTKQKMETGIERYSMRRDAERQEGRAGVRLRANDRRTHSDWPLQQHCAPACRLCVCSACFTLGKESCYCNNCHCCSIPWSIELKPRELQECPQ